MNVVEQQVIDMTLEEFKKFEIPKGYRMMYVSGEWRHRGELGGYFNMHVVLEKEK